MRNSGNFAKGNRFSARQGSQPLGSREFRARAAALNGYLAEIAALYTRPAGGLFPAGHFFSVIYFVHLLCAIIMQNDEKEYCVLQNAVIRGILYFVIISITKFSFLFFQKGGPEE